MEQKEKPLIQHQNQKPNPPTNQRKITVEAGHGGACLYFYHTLGWGSCIAESIRKAWGTYQDPVSQQKRKVGDSGERQSFLCPLQDIGTVLHYVPLIDLELAM